MLVLKNTKQWSYLGKHHVSLYGCYAIAKSADANGTGDMLGTPVASCQCSNIVNFLPVLLPCYVLQHVLASEI